MAICIPFAFGVPGLGAPPNWWDNALLPPNQIKPDIDDPRWRGAYNQGFGFGTAEEAAFRALYHTGPGGKKSLYLSWHVKWDSGMDINDELWVALTRASGEALIIKIRIANANVNLTAAAPAETHVGKLDAVASTFIELADAPDWVGQTTKVWRDTAGQFWAVHMQVPIKPGAAIDDNEGVDIASTFKMWYRYRIYTPTRSDLAGVVGGVLPLVWPVGLDLTGGGTIFPNPSSWEQASLGSTSSPSCPTSSGISVEYMSIGTANAVSSQIQMLMPNFLFAKPKNNGAVDVPAHAINAKFRFANWGSIIADSAAPWETVLTNISNQGIISAGGALPDNTHDIRAPWTPPAAWVTAMNNGTKSTHQCMLVELSGTGVVFSQSSAYRNMDFIPNSTYRRQAEINLNGLPVMMPRDVYLSVESLNMPEKISDDQDPIPIRARTEGEFDDMDQETQAKIRKLGAVLSAGRERGEGSAELASSVGRVVASEGIPPEMLQGILPTYRVHCYYDTGKREIVNGKTYAVLGLGTSFGYHAVTGEQTVGWAHRLHGAVRVTDNFYVLPVPSSGIAKIENVIQALQPGEQPEPDEPIQPWPEPTTGQGDLLDRILALIDKLQAVLDVLAACADRIDPLYALLRRLARLIRLLPLPADAREAFARLIERIGGIRQRLSVLAVLRQLLEAIEHHLEALDRALDKLHAVAQPKLDELLAKIFGADADRIRKAIAELEAQVRRLDVLLRLFEGLLRTLEELAQRCQEIDGLYALARGLARALEKLHAFGAGLEARFPLLDKLLPHADPTGGVLGEKIALLKKNGEMLDEILSLLDRLATDVNALEKAHEELEAIEYDEVARVADRVYKAAFG